VKQQHPVIERYMTHLETAIRGLDSADRCEVLQEIRNHIAEATAAGRSLDVVLESLGPADALGRAYAVELLLHPQNDRPRHAAERWFRLVGLVVVLSIPTLVSVSTLASVGISFVAGGLFAFVIGVLEAIGIFPWPDLSDVPPVVAIFLGPAMVLVGAAALVALRFYVRFVLRAGRTALAPVRAVDRYQ
jgi:HAAS